MLPSWFQIWAAYLAQCLHAKFEEGHATVDVQQTAFEKDDADLEAVDSDLAFLKDTRSVERS